VMLRESRKILIRSVARQRGIIKTDEQHLYAISELTQLIIQNKATQHSWVISTPIEKVKLPNDIFHNLTDPQAVNDVRDLSAGL
jgi:hypothetical protein